MKLLHTQIIERKDLADWFLRALQKQGINIAKLRALKVENYVDESGWHSQKMFAVMKD